MVNWQTFIVRIWQEGSSGTWRGQIVHLPDQDSRHFATIPQAAAFIAQYVSGVGVRADASDRSADRPAEENP